MALRIVAIAEVEQPVQHHHEGEEPAPEKHQFEQPPLVQLHGGNDADDDGRRHAERQLAIELLDAIGAHQRGSARSRISAVRASAPAAGSALSIPLASVFIGAGPLQDCSG